MNLKLVFLVLFIFFFHITKSQELYYSFEHVTIDDGLSSNSINEILQDKKGFIWFLTSKGLNRYDGSSVKISKFDNLKLNKNNPIQSFCVDNKDCLWILFSKSIFKLNLKTEKISKIKNINLEGFNKILFDSISNCVWIGHSKGLFKLNIETNKFKIYKKDSHDPNSIPKTGLMYAINDNKNNLWFTFWANGITKYNRISDNFEHFTHKIDKNSVFDKPIFGLASDYESNIWMASLNSDTVCKYDVNKNIFQFFGKPKYTNTNYLWGIMADKCNKIWFTSPENSVSVYNPKTDNFTQIEHESNNPESLSENRASLAVFLDKNDNMWIASMNKGVNKTDLKLSNVNYFPIDNNLLKKPTFVKSIFEDSIRIWTCNEEGVFIYDLNKKKYNKLKIPNENNRFYKILNLFDNQKLIIGTKNSYFVNENNLSIKKFESSVFKNDFKISASYIDKNNVLWIVTSKNIYTFKNNNLNKPINIFKIPDYIVPELFIYVDFLELNDDLLISAETELILFDTKNYILKKSSLIDSVFKNKSRMTSIYKFKDSIYVYNIYGWKTFDLNYNLKTNHLYPFLFEDEVVPISYNYNDTMVCLTTYRGIFIYNLKTKKYIHPRIFNPDKINPDVFIKSKYNNNFYLSAGTGLVSFKPSELEKTSLTSDVTISDFKLFNKSVSAIDEKSPIKKAINYEELIELNYDQNVFSFELAILNYDEVNRNKFLYKMEGFDKEWNFIGYRKTATFTNLSPGEYTFKYKGRDKNDNETLEKSIRIVIYPPFWETWWFRIFIILLFLSLLYIIYKLRIRNIKQRQIELEHQVILRTAEILSQKEEIMAQKEDIEQHEKRITELYEDIKDSITTAQRIQESILPPENLIKQCLPESFVLYLPKDIVSGDFYWFHVDVDRFYIAAVDCTGHGVAGAFMSLIAHNLLNKIIKDERTLSPNQILDRLNSYIIQVLHQESEHPISKDGMDISICMIINESKEIQVSGANNGIYYIRNGVLEQVRANKNSVGIQPMGKTAKFENFIMPYQKGDKFYMFSDGFAGQFGGLNSNEKMKYNRFRECLINHSQHDMTAQKEALFKMLKDFQQSTEQTDDILVMGFEL